MRRRLTLVSAVVALAACHRARAPEDSAVQARATMASDTNFLRPCASAPETTSTGSVGCVLKDQSRRLPARKDRPR